ncbi:heat-inducible transcriptional repressor HrcA [Paenibacillus macerans]|uniref:heat-inducible transcriptional repressor HrcA n=1 Tax=Paenibacillus macerans TaxID=44252 RepID=UPI001B21AE37|nr:heat-inducible transcriptional repressor HrcA [Paenibacillus macerans]MBS5909687.1 heat-inducible transcription repressor HrcA [Paenibacillus macerans]MEC0141186.1 heat-inducible transcriptional repressor HrcA [Paenibacillus macerans]MEC0334051.1 heat-inducible transcriptional repressor HrcA [Paenibacillus macerans]UMV47012.1 heat-inducible transcriptional repressor HrcA [Paenibacillus macerans]GIP13246.1 heat-inducible transcription repressor HrcA [Paenibacillus macerans]
MLTERQRMILTAIVDDYIRSAEPVGSRSISKRGDVGYSPATIRNEMADLEELGFLEQPHTSAGRIPSIKGYRYYVDHLTPLNLITPEELKTLKAFFAEKLNAAEQVIQHAGTILSHMTNYTSILLGPEVFHTSLRHFGLLSLNENTAVAILVTNTGQVENKTVSIPAGVSVSEIERVVNLLNVKLAGLPIYKLKTALYNEIGQEMQRHIEHFEELMKVLDQVLDSGSDGQRLFLSGATNMLTQPEFRDVDKVKSILDLLEETPTLTKMMSSASLGSGIQVRIGTENDHEAFANCSLITATYQIEGETVGTIGILGPTRMEYGRVMRILDILSKDLSKFLSRLH